MNGNLEYYCNQINAKFVRLDDEERKRNNNKLQEVLSKTITELKKDSLFDALYSRSPFYGGSYYDNLKVSKPNEYDIGMLLDLPKLSSPILKPSTKCGYVNAKISLDEINRQDYLKPYRGLSKLVDGENYLSVSAVNKWFEGLVQTALNNIKNITVKMRKSGPAITLRVYLDDSFEYFDVDLVPFFFFTNKYWPEGYRMDNSYDGFFIVPKLLKDGDVRKWRAAFQYQEKNVIRDVGKIKPAMRLIKVLRDKENFPLKSYFIKSVFLWELQSAENQTFYSKQTLSNTFLMFMEKLIECLKNREIKYFWHEGFNLLEDWSDALCANVAYRLQNIVKKIKNDPENIWKYFDSPELPPAVYSKDNEQSQMAGQDLAQADNNSLLIGGVVAGLGALAVGGFALYRALSNNRGNE